MMTEYLHQHIVSGKLQVNFVKMFFFSNREVLRFKLKTF